MRQLHFALGALLGLTLVLSGCGGADENQPAKTPDSVDRDPPSKQSPMEELQAIPRNLRAQVAKLTQPIDDIQKVIDQLTSIPERYGIDPSDMMAMARATVESGKVSLKLNADVSDAAKEEIETALKTLKGAVAALEATPDRVEALTARITMLSAKVPALAAKVSASAAAAAANPFADADAKAKAKADLQNVKQAAADVMKVVTDTQEKIVALPGMATSALSKLTAALKGKGGAGAHPDPDDVASEERDPDAGAPSPTRSAEASSTTVVGSSRSVTAAQKVQPPQTHRLLQAAFPEEPVTAAQKGPSTQTPAATDQVVLRNGTTIRGRVLKQTPGTFVTIETADGTQRTIAWDRVSEVVVAPPAKGK